MQTDASELFRVLGVDTRLRILRLLQTEGPAGVKNLAAALGVSPSAVSQHLKVLRQAGLASRKRSGYWVPYSVNQEGLEACCCQLIEACTCGCGRTARRGRPRRDDLVSLVRYQGELAQEARMIRARIARLRRRTRRTREGR